LLAGTVKLTLETPSVVVPLDELNVPPVVEKETFLTTPVLTPSTATVATMLFVLVAPAAMLAGTASEIVG